MKIKLFKYKFFKITRSFFPSSLALFTIAACGASYPIETNLIDDPSGDIPNYVVSQIVSSMNNPNTYKKLKQESLQDTDLKIFMSYAYNSKNQFHFFRVKRMIFFSTSNRSDNPPQCDATITLKLGTPFNCLASGGEFTISFDTNDKSNQYWNLYFDSWVQLDKGVGVFHMDSINAVQSINKWTKGF